MPPKYQYNFTLQIYPEYELLGSEHVIHFSFNLIRSARHIYIYINVHVMLISIKKHRSKKNKNSKYFFEQQQKIYIYKLPYNKCWEIYFRNMLFFFIFCKQQIKNMIIVRARCEWTEQKKNFKILNFILLLLDLIWNYINKKIK
jgi:hypothetical protein